MLLDLLMRVRLASPDLPLGRLLRRLDRHLLMMDELDARLREAGHAGILQPRDTAASTASVHPPSRAAA